MCTFYTHCNAATSAVVDFIKSTTADVDAATLDHYSLFFLNLTVLSGVGALQVNIPQELYESARGDNITLPCSFTPKTPLKETKVVNITWSAEAAEAGAEEVRLLLILFR